MTPHSCLTITPDCYRCDLNKDELIMTPDELLDLIDQSADQALAEFPDIIHNVQAIMGATRELRLQTQRYVVTDKGRRDLDESRGSC